MITKAALCAAGIAAGAVIASSAVAHGNPATPMPTIESSSAQLCSYINDDPTENGVVEGLSSLGNRSLDEMDAQLVVITALHHVCPQHEELVMNSMIPFAEEEICTSADVSSSTVHGLSAAKAV